MPTCKICKCEKPTREMRMWGGIATETCQACYDEKKVGKVPAEPAPPALVGTRAAAPALEFSVAPTMGFTAKVEGEDLTLSQVNSARPDDDDVITLSRAEAKQLFGLFGEWAST